MYRYREQQGSQVEGEWRLGEKMKELKSTISSYKIVANVKYNLRNLINNIVITWHSAT